jgi:hypothetical protein
MYNIRLILFDATFQLFCQYVCILFKFYFIIHFIYSLSYIFVAEFYIHFIYSLSYIFVAEFYKVCIFMYYISSFLNIAIASHNTRKKCEQRYISILKATKISTSTTMCPQCSCPMLAIYISSFP